MENKPNNEISELLASLRKNVEQGADEKPIPSESGNNEATTGELLDRLRRHIGATGEMTGEEPENQDYNINGYEFSAEDEESGAETKTETEAEAEAPVMDVQVSAESNKETDDTHEESVSSPLSTEDELLVKATVNTEEDDSVPWYSERDPKNESLEDSVSCEAELFSKQEREVAETFSEEEGDYTEEQREAIRERVRDFVQNTLDPTESVELIDSVLSPSFDADASNDGTQLPSDEVLVLAESSEPEGVIELADGDEEISDDGEEYNRDLEPVNSDLQSFFGMDDANQSGAKMIREIDEFDDIDINLAMSLGAREALEESIGYARVRSAGNGFYDPSMEEMTAKRAYGSDSREFRSYEQTDEIKRRYYLHRKRQTVSLISMSLLAVLILFFEHLPFTSINIPYISDLLKQPMLFYGGSLILSAVCIALLFRRIGSGLRALLGLHGDPFACVSLLAVLNLIYNATLLIFFRDAGLPVYNFAVVVFLILGMTDDRMRLSLERMAFDVISDKRPKLSLERLEADLHSDEGGILRQKENFFVEKVNFIGNFFGRMGKRPLRFREYFAELVVCVIGALLITVLSTYISQTTAYAWNTLLFVMLLCLPMQSLTLGIYPFFRLTKGLSGMDSAVLGEAVIDEYDAADTVYLDDVEMFGKHGVQISGLRVYNDRDFYEILSYALSVFTVLGAPLCNVFDSSAKEIEKTDDVKITGITDGGVSASVGNESNVLIGNAEFMRSNGFYPKHNPDDEKKSENGHISILYLVIGNEICAKFYMQYNVTMRFEKFAAEMIKNGVKVGIRTLDPNVNEKMIAALREDKQISIKVMRPTPNELIPIGKHSNSGIVTAKNSHMIFRILAQCFNIKRIHMGQKNIRFLYILLGFALSIVVMSLKLYPYIPPLFIVIYQLLWMLPALIYTKSNLK